MFSHNNSIHEPLDTAALAAFMGVDVNERPDLFGELEPATDMSYGESYCSEWLSLLGNAFRGIHYVRIFSLAATGRLHISC